jgi:N-methylhydantoinase A/oxoprolinase/acetone carboxylase beta subunit
VTPLRIGVDVGGTNTDAVAVSGSSVLAHVKRPTTADVLSGMLSSLKSLLSVGGIEPERVEAVMIGTTHFTNAVVEASELAPVGVLRLSGPATRAVPPMVDWPDRIRSKVDGGAHFLTGGHEFDGRPMWELDPEEIATTAKKLADAGVLAVALTSVFSPVNDAHERAVATLLTELLPGAVVSRSNEIGRIGLVERENATILNSSLRPLADRMVAAFEQATVDLGIEADLFLTQNDGTLMGADHTRRYPVATFASGPTNSMRGAAFLSGETDCAVIDVGGTTTDVGIIRNSFPREAPLAVDIGGVRTNFRMPDLLSIGIGGGSLVRSDREGITVGPDSVGFRLAERGLAFGGDTPTATDIAVAAGTVGVGDPSLVEHLDRGLVAEALEVIRTGIADAVDRLKTGPEPIPAVLVGGGSILLGDDLPGVSRLVRPERAEVANAIGAAMSQVGGQVDRIVALEGRTRDEAIETVRREAEARCAAAGADPGSIRIVEVEEVPLAYLPSNAVRISIRAVGDLR